MEWEEDTDLKSNVQHLIQGNNEKDSRRHDRICSAERQVLRIV